MLLKKTPFLSLFRLASLTEKISTFLERESVKTWREGEYTDDCAVGRHFA